MVGQRDRGAVFRETDRRADRVRTNQRSAGESARSADLRAIGALGAAKRPPQLPQESRSGFGWWDGIGGQRDRSATSSIDRDQRSARSLMAFVSRCYRLAIRQTLSGRTTLAAEQLRPHRQRSPSPR